MGKSLISAADAREMVRNLSSARLERIENSLMGQIEAACAEGETETFWRSPLPVALAESLEKNGYKIEMQKEERTFVISWSEG